MRIERMMIVTLLLPLLLVTMTQSASAAVPQLMNYQGRLTNNVGGPLDTTVAVTFTIYGDSLGTSMLWEEVHPSVTVTNGLFQAILGSVSSLPQSVFDGSTRWLGVEVEKEPASVLMPLVSSAYAYRSNVTDTAAIAKTVSDNAITSAKIQNGTISFTDIGQNSATTGEVIKWNGSAWEAQADNVSAGGTGWVDNGTVVRLETSTDSVGIGTATPNEKLHVNGAARVTSRLELGEDSISVSGSGGDMVVLARGDVWNRAGESYYFGAPGQTAWMRIDNPSERVGIGTTSSVDEKLQVESSDASGRAFLQLETSHATSFGETGIRFKTPQNTWHLRMDDFTNNNLPDGALGLRSQTGVETMTWLEGGNVGIGTTSPSRKLHVNGSVQVKDTVYAGAINPSLMAALYLPDEPGLAVGAGTGGIYLGTNIGSLTAFDSATIAVPGPGYVFACGSVTLESDHSGADITMVAVWISRQLQYAEDNSQTVTLENSLPSGSYRIPLTTNAVFTVTAAEDVKFYMVGDRYGDDAVNAQHSKLTLIYIPTAYGDTKSAAAITGGDTGERVKAQTEAKSRAGTQTSQQVDLTSEVRALREEIESLKKELRKKK